MLSTGVTLRAGIFALLLFSPGLLFAQPSLIDELNRHIVPLQSLEPGANYSDLKGIDKYLAGKRIIALGEATHGTHEFFTSKHRLIEYLVKEQGFKTVVIEADFAGTRVLNDYVLKDEGSFINALMHTGMGVLFTKEFEALVQWVKAYNRTQTYENKIKFYGCDMQQAYEAANLLLEGDIKLADSLSISAKKGLKFIRKYTYGAVNKADAEVLKALSAKLKTVKILGTDGPAHRLNQRYIDVINQTIEYALQKYMFDKDVVRDRYMADNCEWIYNHEHQNKMIVWAHNIHIAKDFVKNNILQMGAYLSQKFPAEYYAIGYGFNSGKLKGYSMKERKSVVYDIPEVSIDNSSDAVFGKCASPNFMLDFKSAAESTVIKQFLNKKINSRSVGGDYSPEKQATGGNGTYQKLAGLYDAIIFIRATTAAVPLP